MAECYAVRADHERRLWVTLTHVPLVIEDHWFESSRPYLFSEMCMLKTVYITNYRFFVDFSS